MNQLSALTRDSQDGNLNVFGYQTEFFNLDEDASKVFGRIVSETHLDDSLKDMVAEAAEAVDNLLMIESSEDLDEDAVADAINLGQDVLYYVGALAHTYSHDLAEDFGFVMPHVMEIVESYHEGR